MRRAPHVNASITVVLVAALAIGACGADPVAQQPPTVEPVPSTTVSGPDASSPLDECSDVTTEPGTDGVAWLAATDDPWGFMSLPAAVDHGFAIGTDSCITIVDTDGTRRWSRATGHVLHATQAGDHIVVVTTPTVPDGAMLTAYDSTTGATVWDDRTTTGVWHTVTALGSVVVLTGTGNGRVIATFDASTGHPLHARTGDFGAAPAFPLPHGDRVVIGGTDSGDGRLIVVDDRGAIVLDEPAMPRFPVPVAVYDDTVVLQASGTDDNTDDVESPSFLAGYDLATGTQQWRLTVEGDRAQRAVQVSDTVVVGTDAGLTAIEIPTGTVRWTDDTPVEETTQITAVGRDAVAVGVAGTLTVREIGDGSPRWERPISSVARLIGTATGERLLLADDAGRYVVIDAQNGTDRWSATGPVPTQRDTLPGHTETPVADGTLATISCPVPLHPCDRMNRRTDERIVAIDWEHR
jgi:outer membrane protein assembly factor BamB